MQLKVHKDHKVPVLFDCLVNDVNAVPLKQRARCAGRGPSRDNRGVEPLAPLADDIHRSIRERQVFLPHISFHKASTSTMGYSRKRKSSDDADEEVAIAKRSKGGSSLPAKQSDADGNPYWEVRINHYYH